MSLLIQVYSDYTCPYSYLTDFCLEEVAKGRDLLIERRPFERHPFPQPTLSPDEEYLKRTWVLSVEPLARRLGVPITLPRISPQPHTHLAFEGQLFAREHDREEAYYRRVMTAFFQEGQDLGKPAVLARVAAEVGLEERAFRAALETRRYREAHQRALHAARIEVGIMSVPTLFVGGKRLVGFQTRLALERAIGRGLEPPPLPRRRGGDKATGTESSAPA